MALVQQLTRLSSVTVSISTESVSEVKRLFFSSHMSNTIYISCMIHMHLYAITGLSSCGKELFLSVLEREVRMSNRTDVMCSSAAFSAV